MHLPINIADLLHGNVIEEALVNAVYHRNKPKSKKQQYKITTSGIAILKKLNG